MSAIDFNRLARFSAAQTHIFFMEEQVGEMEAVLAKIDKLIAKEVRVRERYRSENRMNEWVNRDGLRNLNQCLMYRQGVKERIQQSEDWINELWTHYESGLHQPQRS